MAKFYFSSNSGLIEIKRQSHSDMFANENLYIFMGSNDLCNKETFRIICKDIMKLRTSDALSQELIFSPIVIISDLPNNEKSRKHFNSLFFNSSIWFRYVQSSQIETELVKTNNELAFFRAKGLYEDPNAREFFDFHLRLQNENFLNDGKSEGHGRNVTPVIYSDECDSITSIKKINGANEPHSKLPLINLYNKVTYNILLVDDKKNKGELIKNLMNQNVYPELYDKTLWNEGEVIHEFFKHNDKEDEIEFIKRIQDFGDDLSLIGKTKIFQVSSVRDTISLLSNDKWPIRFDLVLMDFLLDIDSSGKREYSTLFFKWFTENKNESAVDTFKLGLKDDELIRSIKDNRGPLQKVWIFPITAFNQTFIDDLRNNDVRLTDYYWHISRGADPINTPYLFVQSLNMFLYLQLQQAVYDLNTLTTFLVNSAKKIKTMEREDFQAHMSSEYTVLIQKHGWRSVISRDANSGSLFSKYIWTHFYSDPANKYLFRMMNKMQKFYHLCTFADETDYDKMMLYWKELDIFIADYWGKLKSKTIGEVPAPPDLSSFRNQINNFLD